MEGFLVVVVGLSSALGLITLGVGLFAFPVDQQAKREQRRTVRIQAVRLR